MIFVLSPAQSSWYSVLPPLLVVCLAFATHRLIVALLLGIALAGSLASFYGPSADGFVQSFMLASGLGFVAKAISDPWNQQILAFIFLVMTMITTMIYAGGFQAVVERLAKNRARGRISTKFMTAVLGLLLFFDDYVNSMIIGTGMRPLTDRMRISREKLAFIVDATAAPIAGLAIVSTWIGYEVGLFEKVGANLGVERDGYAMFFDALGFRFYCLFMIVFVFVNVLSGRDFGPMITAEARALATQDRLTQPPEESSKEDDRLHVYQHARLSIWNAFLPVVGLLFCIFVGLWIDGGGFSHMGLLDILSLESWRSVLVKADHTATIFAISGMISLVLSITLARFIASVPFSKNLEPLKKGLKAAFLPALILVLAWSLNESCDYLKTGHFLASTLAKSLSALSFPILLFLLAGLVGFSTGTSWGTMAILIPTAIPIAYELDGSLYGRVTMMSLGAVLDGAIFGDHCSPISDTTVISSAASGCDNIAHVKTQLPYSIVTAFIAIGSGYFLAGLGYSLFFSFTIGILMIVLVQAIFGRSPVGVTG